MKIHKITDYVPSCANSVLLNTTIDEVTNVLNLEPVMQDVEKIRHVWHFVVESKICVIWDYRWSAMYGELFCYMPFEIGNQLFGSKFVFQGWYRPSRMEQDSIHSETFRIEQHAQAV